MSRPATRMEVREAARASLREAKTVEELRFGAARCCCRWSTT